MRKERKKKKEGWGKKTDKELITISENEERQQKEIDPLPVGFASFESMTLQAMGENEIVRHVMGVVHLVDALQMGAAQLEGMLPFQKRKEHMQHHEPDQSGKRYIKLK